MGRSPVCPVVDVVIPVFNAYEDLVRCLESVRLHAEEIMRLCIIDDQSTDPRVWAYIESYVKSVEFQVVCLRNDENLGFLQTANRGMFLSEANDVLLLNSDTVVTKSWLSKLRRVAYGDDNIATVTPLSNNATICSVPEYCRENEIPHGYSIDEFGELVENVSLRIYPEIPTGVGFCLYIKRFALNILGGFDAIYGRGYNEENDFCFRARSYCLKNVMADDTFVFHAGSKSFSLEKEAMDRKNHKKLIARYPNYDKLVERYSENRKIQIWDNLNVALHKQSVCLDGRCLSSSFTGTQRYLTELIRRFVSSEKVSTVYLWINAGSEQMLKDMFQPEGIFDVVFVSSENAESLIGYKGCDVFHRTFQLNSMDEIYSVAVFFKRFVLSHLDTISIRNDTYFTSFEAWDNYCQVARQGLAVADKVIAISEHAKKDICDSLDVPSEKVAVTLLSGENSTFSRLAQSSDVPENEYGDYILCVGTDFKHKNLKTVILLFKELVHTDAADVKLVLAGPEVSTGGEIGELKKIVQSDKSLKERVIFLGSVSDEKLYGLYRNAKIFVYLSIYEGFGIPPLEAFSVGCPVISSSSTSVSEVVMDATSCFHPGDVAGIREEILRLLNSESARQILTTRGAARFKEFSWDKTANETLAVYLEAIRFPGKKWSSLRGGNEGAVLLIRRRGMYHLVRDSYAYLRRVGPRRFVEKALHKISVMV